MTITSVALDLKSIARKKTHSKKITQVFLLANNAKKTLFATVSTVQPNAVVNINVTGDFSLIVKGSGIVHLSGWLQELNAESQSLCQQKTITKVEHLDTKSLNISESLDNSEDSKGSNSSEDSEGSNSCNSSSESSDNSSESSSEHESTKSTESDDEENVKSQGMKLMVSLEAETTDTSYEKLDGSNKRGRAKKKAGSDKSAPNKQKEEIKKETKKKTKLSKRVKK